MAKKETKKKSNINAFKRCIHLLIKADNGVNNLYAPPNPRYYDGMPVVFVSYDPCKPLKRMSINQLLGYDTINDKIRDIDYTLFDYTKYMKPIDDVIKNSAKKPFKWEYK